jgi:anti-sigma B factor antagonist
MQIATSKIGFINVIAPNTPLIDAHVNSLNQVIKDSLKNGEAKILIDLSGVSHIDSKGLELLLDSFEEVKKLGGDIKLCNVNQLCTDIFIATRMSSFLEIYKTPEEAAQSYI